MKGFFKAIEDLFVNYLFAPYDALRHLELESWWLANIMSWILLVTGIVAFIYWMKQLKNFDENTEHHHEYDHHINAHTTHHTIEH